MPQKPDHKHRTRASRGRFDEIISIGDTLAGRIVERFRSALPERFITETNRRGGVHSINLDLYGYDEAQNVAVVQIREFYRKKDGYYPEVKKDYVLVGFGEHTGEALCHPVGAHAVRAGVRKASDDPTSAVRAAQCWMWNVTDKQLDASLRQGDLLMVPQRSLPADATARLNGVAMGGSHLVRSPVIACDPADLRIVGAKDGEPAIFRIARGDHGSLSATVLSNTLPAMAVVQEVSFDNRSVKVGEPAFGLDEVAEIRVVGHVFAQNPSVHHAKGQHDSITAGDHDGWYSLRVGAVAAAHNAAKTKD